jgi:Flp pilus assembly protein TadG
MAKGSSARRARRNGRDGRRGQSLVEFALVFPLFILLLAGMIDFGMGLYSYMTINNAAREAARLGVTMCSVSPCRAAVIAKATAAAGGLGPSIQVACGPGANPAGNCSAAAASGDNVKVTVDYDYHMIWPLAFGTTIHLTSSMTMLID